MNNERGKFIVLEGQGFTGKTEQAKLLTSALILRGLNVVETQEPGGVSSAIAIRDELLKRRAEGSITPKEEVDLFYDSRSKFLAELVIPSLDKGVWVVSSRFSASTPVYQGFEGGVDLNYISQKEDEIVGDNQPDLYLLLDVQEKEVLRRMLSGKRNRHGYNEVDENKIVNRRIHYLQLASENKYGNWKIIDGEGSIMEVHARVLQAVITFTDQTGFKLER